MKLLLGVIADDFTGATDVASTLVQQGMRVIQALGVPAEDFDCGDAQAVVVALKSRSNPPAEAIGWSLDALRWLRARGAAQILFKYCSTFDSTVAGNIGPVADALLDETGSRFAIVCPAFPDNRRTVYQGHLFVGDQLLSESPMKDHPLTPMRDSSLPRLMQAQSSKRVGLIAHDIVARGAQAVERAIDELCAMGFVYGVVDALSNADLEIVGAAVADHPLVTGGSAIGRGLALNFARRGLLGNCAAGFLPPPGRGLVIAGSCAASTRRQVAAVRDAWPHRKIDLDALHRDPATVETIVDWAIEQDDSLPVLVYASSTPREVKSMQEKYGVEAAGEKVEAALSAVACRLVAAGFGRLVVAGGETSGAVLSALAVRALGIGRQIDPGVPWTFTLDRRPLALALKSGNFGRDDFFRRAFDILDQA